MSFPFAMPERLPVAAAGFSPLDDDLDFRQLRHQTKNALQRIIGQIDGSGLRETVQGQRLADEIERRVCLTARISDALFGLRQAPGPLPPRLIALAENVVALASMPEQTIGVEVTISGVCPPGLHQTVIRVAHEMLCNAVQHGMHLRLVGRIVVKLWVEIDGRIVLSVADDGWGFEEGPTGSGLPIMRQLAGRCGGRVALTRGGGWTVARMDMPVRTAPLVGAG